MLAAVFVTGAQGQNRPDKPAESQTVTFRFVAGEDMFYIPYAGNGDKLEALYRLVEQYRTEITSGQVPMYVDGYCASGDNAQASFKMAVTRSNRVKSELITHKGLSEEYFITKNYAKAYTTSDGTIYKDMVVVTLNIPAKAQPKPEAETKVEVVEPDPKPVVKEEPAPVAEKQQEPAPVMEAEPTAPIKPYYFALRTNLLYDAFLTPTLGVEWRINNNIGIKVDGSRSWWGDEKGKVQKIWLVSPEVRWYMLDAKRFYVGASANFGEYNIYKGMLGGLFSDDTGYQGKLWSAGLTVGYQLYLSRSFSLDFNLGLGYTRLEYDSFTMVGETRVYKDRDKTKNFWGPTQAGISLIWTIGK